jgi:hypothetical protein
MCGVSSSAGDFWRGTGRKWSMAGTTKKKAARKSRSKKTDKIPPFVTELDEAQLGEMMQNCKTLGVRLGHLTLRLLIEQKQRAHERRMAALKQAGSTVAYAPLALVKGVIGAARGIGGFVTRRFRAACPQEATSS